MGEVIDEKIKEVFSVAATATVIFSLGFRLVELAFYITGLLAFIKYLRKK